MKLGDKIRITARGYRMIHRLTPGFLGTMAARSALSALLPFINIFMSAKIVTSLALRATFRQVIFLVAVTAALNVAAALLTSLTDHLQAYHEAKFYRVYEQPLNEKIERMDYELVEDTKIHLMRQHIETLRQTSGMGLSLLVWSCRELVRGFFTTVFSLSLLGGAFTLSHTGDPGVWSFLFSPLSIPLVITLIACNIAVGILSTRGSTKKMAEIFGGLVPLNRKGQYYYDYLNSYKAGKDLKLYALNTVVANEYGNLTGICNRIMAVWRKATAKFDGLAAASNTVLTGLIYVYVAVKALFGAFGVGGIVQYVGSLSQLSGGVSAIMENLTMLSLNADALALYFEFLDLPDKKYRGTLPVEKRNDNEYALEFHDVSFRYPGTDAFALSHLNLKLNIGQRLAVVGQNGSGKTTMIKLLCRLYDPTEGEITLNGIDIRKYDYAEYLSLFGVVFQDFRLFSFGLGQNVAAAVGYDREKAAAALEKAGFRGRLASLPKGLETPLYKDFEEDGVEISGGEAQKIALARALYKDAPFIVLDEPTAALDPLAEYEIYSKFDGIVGEKTAVYISHRLSSCRFCDDIAVFHEGKLIQRGSHETLLAEKGGKYAQLWDAQAQYYATKPENPV